MTAFVAFVPWAISAAVAPAVLDRCAAVINQHSPPSAYAERLLVGRRAQFGDDLIYRPGSIGCAIDGAQTYGEFDLGLFAASMDRALDGLSTVSPVTFVDVGSGVGRLVLAAALLWPSRLARCAGVEYVAELHRLALAADAAVEASLPASVPPRKYICADAADVLGAGGELADASLIFAYSSAFASEGDLLSDFSAVCGTCLRVGTRVVTTDRQLCSVDGLWHFELLASVEGTNAEVRARSLTRCPSVPLSCA
jgi:hypothetical protein